MGSGWASEFNAIATALVEDPKFPGADVFALAPVVVFEQQPVHMDPCPRDNVHLLMRLDPDKVDPRGQICRCVTVGVPLKH